MSTSTKGWSSMQALFGQAGACGETNTRSLSWFESGDIGPARKAILENLNAASFPLSAPTVIAEPTNALDLSERPTAKEPEVPFAFYGVVGRVASVRAVVICALVGAWTVVEAETTRPIALLRNSLMHDLGQLALQNAEDYPIADFFMPVQYNWKETDFEADRALTYFSEHTNADC
ncbi:MAG TPA: hypothetical protein VFE62_03380 [Gemmataceae bacterium]|nr:hypothetical protein [Gemmataceae bacterium]